MKLHAYRDTASQGRTADDRCEISVTQPSAVDIPPASLLLGWTAQRCLASWRGRRTDGAKRTKSTAASILIVAAFTGLSFAADAADIGASEGERVAAAFIAVDEAAAKAGFYFGTRTKIAATQDTSYNTRSGPAEASYDPSFGGGVLVGIETGPRIGPLGLRGEVELGYFTSNVDEISVRGVTRSSDDSVGSLSGYTGFANAYIDANLGAFGGAKNTPLQRVKPFVGAGIGVAHVGLDGQGTFSDGRLVDDWETAAAFQVSAGMRIDITERMSVELGYRREMIPDLSFDATDGTKNTVDITRDMFTIGLQRRF